MKQVATVAANGAKKAEAAALAKQQTVITVKKQITAQNSKLKPKEKQKSNNGNLNAVKNNELSNTVKESEDVSHEEERKDDKSALVINGDNDNGKQLIIQAGAPATQPS